jgi:hypothetical protein
LRSLRTTAEALAEADAEEEGGAAKEAMIAAGAAEAPVVNANARNSTSAPYF